jgi:hypothetical protein
MQQESVIAWYSYLCLCGCALDCSLAGYINLLAVIGSGTANEAGE